MDAMVQGGPPSRFTENRIFLDRNGRELSENEWPPHIFSLISTNYSLYFVLDPYPTNQRSNKIYSILPLLDFSLRDRERKP